MDLAPKRWGRKKKLKNTPKINHQLMLIEERPMILETLKYAIRPMTVPVVQPRNIIRDNSAVKMLKIELVRQPKAFIMPMSETRSDIERENKKNTTNTPLKTLRMLTNTVKREKTKENPNANPFAVIDSILNPTESPRRMMKIVEATHIAKPKIVRKVESFLLLKSLKGKGVSLKAEQSFLPLAV